MKRISTALCLVLTVAACGGSASPDDSTTTAPTTTTAPATTTTTTTTPILPAWALPFFSAEEFGAFGGLVIQYWAGTPAVVDLEAGTIDHPELGVLGLLNLAQDLAQRPMSEWADTVAAHFDAISSVPNADEELAVLLADWELLAPRLRIRVYGVDALADTGIDAESALVTNEFAPGLFEILVIDFPDTTRTVTPDSLAALDVDVETALAVARMNTLEVELVSSEPLDVGCDVDFYGGSFYTASHILGIENLLSEDNEFGALVAVPRREDLLVYEVRDQAIICAAVFMAQLVPQVFAEGPGGVSPDFYWYYEGEFYPVDLDFDTGEFEVPQALRSVLANLPP